MVSEGRNPPPPPPLLAAAAGAEAALPPPLEAAPLVAVKAAEVDASQGKQIRVEQ